MKFAKKVNFSDDDIRKALERLQQGYVDAYLGSGVYKQRYPRKGGGLSRGYRLIIILPNAETIDEADTAIFVHGFAKSDKGDLNSKEEKGFRNLSVFYGKQSPEDIQSALLFGDLVEVN